MATLYHIQTIAELEGSAERFLGSFRTLSDPQWRWRPGAGIWSVGEVAEHIAGVEVGVLKLFQRKLTTQPTPPEVLQETVGKEGAIERRLGSGGPAVEAPAFTLPTGRWTDAESLSRDFNASRLGLITFIRVSSLDLSRYAAPHPVLGPLTGYQWGYFVSLHTDRHVRQIEGLKTRPGFPTT